MKHLNTFNENLDSSLSEVQLRKFLNKKAKIELIDDIYCGSININGKIYHIPLKYEKNGIKI